MKPGPGLFPPIDNLYGVGTYDLAVWLITSDEGHILINTGLADGGCSDADVGGRQTFEPVTVEHILRKGEVIELGDIRLTVHEHPGHTEGSSSYSMVVNENGRDYAVVIANMGTINLGKVLTGEPTYPGVAEDFSNTYRKQKAIDVDVWVAAHQL